MRLTVVLSASPTRFFGSAGTIARGLLPRLIQHVDSVNLLTDAPQYIPEEIRGLVDGRCHGLTRSRVLAPIALARLARSISTDVIYFPYTFEAEWIWTRTPYIVTVHDLVALKMPADFPHTSRRWRMLTAPAVRRATLVATVSRFSATDITHLLGVPRERVRVIPNGVETRIAGGRSTVPERPYILYVASSGYPFKNIPMLLRAFDDVADRMPHDLHVVVMPVERFWSDITSTLDSLRWKDRICIRSFLSPEQLRDEYSGAALFAYPSRHEGFGLPLLEAMSYNLPIITGRVASIPEVVGDAAWYCDTGNQSEIGEAMLRLASDHDLRSQIVLRAKVRMEALSWDRTAQQVAAVCEEAIDLRKRSDRKPGVPALPI